MSQSATPATQNDMTTCLETFEKEIFCSFPFRHGDATGKPETRDKTRGCRKTSISCETSSNFDIFDTLSNRLECHKVPRLPRKTTWQPAWKPSNRRCFGASPLDTATPQENKRLEARHVGGEKRAFRARPPPLFTFCSFKIDVFLRGFLGTSKFCYFKINVSCEASVHFQHMSQNATPATKFAPCRHLTQPCQCDLQKTRNTIRLKCCACHEKWRWTRPKCCACTKNATHLLKTSQKYCACHTKRLSTRYKTRLNVTKCHACHAKRSNDALETSKNDHLCRTSHRHGHTEFVRRVADGCGRLRTVATTNATSREHNLNPQSENGNPCYAFGKRTKKSQ